METNYWQWFCNLMISGSVISVFLVLFLHFPQCMLFVFGFFPEIRRRGVYSFRHHNYFQCVSDCRSLCLKHSETKQTKSQSLHQRKVYCRDMEGDGWLMALQNPPNSPKGFSNILLKARWGVGLVVTNFLVLESLFLLLSL